MTPPRHPCPWCGSTSFAWIERGKFELTCDAKISSGNVLNPEVSLLVCEGCGHTGWFMREHARQLADIKHKTLTVPVTGYR